MCVVAVRRKAVQKVVKIMKRLVKSQFAPSAEQFVVVRAEVAVWRTLAVCDDDWRPFDRPVAQKKYAVRLRKVFEVTKEKAEKCRNQKMKVASFLLQEVLSVYAYV